MGGCERCSEGRSSRAAEGAGPLRLYFHGGLCCRRSRAARQPRPTAMPRSATARYSKIRPVERRCRCVAIVQTAAAMPGSPDTPPAAAVTHEASNKAATKTNHVCQHIATTGFFRRMDCVAHRAGNTTCLREADFRNMPQRRHRRHTGLTHKHRHVWLHGPKDGLPEHQAAADALHGPAQPLTFPPAGTLHRAVPDGGEDGGEPG
jgi:hypothetical protein